MWRRRLHRFGLLWLAVIAALLIARAWSAAEWATVGAEVPDFIAIGLGGYGLLAGIGWALSEPQK
jgi:hypothetical protein